MTEEDTQPLLPPEPPSAQSNAKPIAIISAMLLGLAVAALVAALSIHGGQQDNAEKLTTVEKKATSAGNKATVQGKAINKLEIRTVHDHIILREKQIIGPHGEPGPGGSRGPRGFPGPQGVKGDTGASFTRADLQTLLDHIPDAVTASCNGSCKGVQGDKGDTGAPGADGANGKPGADGLPGAPGPAGADGAPGPAGPQGATGPQGPAGPAPQPFTFTFADGTGVNHTCTIDPNVGPAVVQGPC